MKYAKILSTPIRQTEPLDEYQVQNNAGGFVFQISDWARLDRFLVLGADAPTYYQNAKSLTRENALCVERCYSVDPARTVDRIVEISEAGRAAKSDAAIFALAIGAAHKDLAIRRVALAALPASVAHQPTCFSSWPRPSRSVGAGVEASSVR